MPAAPAPRHQGFGRRQSLRQRCMCHCCRQRATCSQGMTCRSADVPLCRAPLHGASLARNVVCACSQVDGQSCQSCVCVLPSASFALLGAVAALLVQQLVEQLVRLLNPFALSC